MLTGRFAVFIAGPPGAGKSSVARIVARDLRAALLDSDTLYGPLMPLLTEASPERVRAAVYEGLIEASMSVGRRVVVVAPFTRERGDASAWEHIRARLGAVGLEPVLVWVSAPTEVLLDRLARRGLDRDADKLRDPAAWLEQAHPELAPVVPHIAVDGTQPIEKAAATVLAALELRP